MKTLPAEGDEAAAKALANECFKAALEEDIPAAEILEEALVGFEGTVVLVSHDRRFLETVTTRTASFPASGITKRVGPGGIDLYDGGFKDYAEASLRKQAAAAELEAARARSQESNRSKGKRRA